MTEITINCSRYVAAYFTAKYGKNGIPKGSVSKHILAVLRQKNKGNNSNYYKSASMSSRIKCSIPVSFKVNEGDVTVDKLYKISRFLHSLFYEEFITWIDAAMTTRQNIQSNMIDKLERLNLSDKKKSCLNINSDLKKCIEDFIDRFDLPEDKIAYATLEKECQRKYIFC